MATEKIYQRQIINNQEVMVLISELEFSENEIPTPAPTVEDLQNKVTDLQQQIDLLTNNG